jgi:hypothetical protein
MPGSPQGASPVGTLAGDAAVVDGGRYGKGVRFDGDGPACSPRRLRLMEQGAT